MLGNLSYLPVFGFGNHPFTETEMASPTKPTQTYDFSDWQVTHPADPLPGDELDNQINVLIQSANETIDALAEIQRTDGALANGSVKAETLSPDLYQSILDDVTPDLDDDVAKAEAAAVAAQTYAANASSSASAAGAYASQAQSGANQAASSASSALSSSSSAQQYAGAAQNAQIAAANSDSHATQAAAAAENSEQLAFNWAEYLPGPVPGTPYYSAHWWALQAYNVVTNFTDFGVAAFAGRVGLVVPMDGDYALTMLSDVNLAGVQEGDTLIYVNGTFVPGQASGGGGTGSNVTSFNGRTGDVIPGDNDYALNMLNDVSTAGAVDDYVLTYSNGGWIPKALPPAGNVSGPAAAVISRFAGFTDTTGKLLKDSGYGPSSFALATHSHPTSQITGLDAALANKAPLVHTHVISDVTGLQQALDSKADKSFVTVTPLITNAPAFNTLVGGSLHLVDGAALGAAVSVVINNNTFAQVGVYFDFVLNDAASLTFAAGANVTILSELSRVKLDVKGAGVTLTLVKKTGAAELWNLAGRLSA